MAIVGRRVVVRVVRMFPDGDRHGVRAEPSGDRPVDVVGSHRQRGTPIIQRGETRQRYGPGHTVRPIRETGRDTGRDTNTDQRGRRQIGTPTITTNMGGWPRAIRPFP